MSDSDHDYAAIYKRYLKWNGGDRPLIIVDEQPYFLKRVEINLHDFGRVDSAIDSGIPDTDNNREDKRWVKEYWGVLRRYIESSVNNNVNRFTGNGDYYIFFRPNWRNDELFDRLFRLSK